MPGRAYRGSELTYGDFGLMTLQPGWLTSRQIEAARIAMTRHVKRGGKIWIRVFPDKPITKKPAETRMGTGKGAVEYYVAVVKPGRILYEMEGDDVGGGPHRAEAGAGQAPGADAHRPPQGPEPVRGTWKWPLPRNYAS